MTSGNCFWWTRFRKKYDEAIQKAETTGMPGWEAEQAVFGTSHAEVGTYLLWLWGMPDAVVEAIAYHHTPSQCPAQQASPLTAVYMANVLAHASEAEGGSEEPSNFDPAYVQRLGLPANLRDWGAYGGEVLQKQETR